MDQLYKKPSSYFLFTVLVYTLSIIPTSAQAQLNFKDGYLTTQEGDTLTGLIHYEDWMYTPDQISFRASADAKIQNFTPHEISMFMVEDEYYYSKIVELDQTPLKLATFEAKRPSTRRDTLFLKALVKSRLSLYYYRNERDHFFMERKGQPVKELMKHQYVIQSRGENKVIQNDAYEQQIAFLGDQCPDVNASGVRYRKKHLTTFFKQCNQSIPDATLHYVEEIPRAALSVNIFAGVTRFTPTINYFEHKIRPLSKPNFTLGLGTEFHLPQTRDRGSIFLSLQYFSSRSDNSKSYTDRVEVCKTSVACTSYQETISDVTVDVDYLKLNVGYKHILYKSPFTPYAELGFTAAKLLSEESWGLINSGANNSQYNYRQLWFPQSLLAGGIAGAGITYEQVELNLRGEVVLVAFDHPPSTNLSLAVRFHLFNNKDQ
ncbi:MAG: hypothetical protein ACQETE_03155 [Bacteroidota bacterium]